MKIPYISITGWDGAIRAFFMSNRKYTPEIEQRLSKVEGGFPKEEDVEWYEGLIKKVIFYGKHHTTLLRFVDVTWVVTDMHRGAQDDFDSHAKRFENRIVRASSRFGNADSIHKLSSYFDGKILTFQDLIHIFELPTTVNNNDATYKLTENGYVRQDCIDDSDVKRGLLPMAWASMFTVKCNICELCHIFRERSEGTRAHPELQEMMEELVQKISSIQKEFNRDFFLSCCNQ